MKYFHELTEDEWLKLVKGGITWLELAKTYTGPPWCKEGAINVDPLGCWSLIAVGKDYRITKESDCKDCDLYKKESE